MLINEVGTVYSKHAGKWLSSITCRFMEKCSNSSKMSHAHLEYKMAKIPKSDLSQNTSRKYKSEK
jgi:hypothetical protein